jgi:hypothetical protein
MAARNGYRIEILDTRKKPFAIVDDEVVLDAGTEFEVNLVNETERRVAVLLKIDDRQKGNFLVQPWASFSIQRGDVEGDTCRFRFDAVESDRGRAVGAVLGKPTNGLVVCTFTPEKRPHTAAPPRLVTDWATPSPAPFPLPVPPSPAPTEPTRGHSWPSPSPSPWNDGDDTPGPITRSGFRSLPPARDDDHDSRVIYRGAARGGPPPEGSGSHRGATRGGAKRVADLEACLTAGSKSTQRFQTITGWLPDDSAAQTLTLRVFVRAGRRLQSAP